MKQIFIGVLAILVWGSHVSAEEIRINFDSAVSGQEKPFNIGDAIKSVSSANPISPFRVDQGQVLTVPEKQQILLSIDRSAWTESSSNNYAYWWMPIKFKLVGGTTLLVDVYQSVMRKVMTIPVKKVGDNYEYGAWTYSHCGGSLAENWCYYKIKVQFEVVSDSVLQGTIYSTNAVGSQEDQFVFYKKDSNKLYQGFAEYEGGQFGRKVFSQPKSIPQVNCWEDNCRMETACGKIKSCNRKCQLLGVACGVAGTSITLYYTGNTQPTLASLIGGFANVGCNAACEDWACSDIPDCKPVKKCDTHCVTTSASGDLVNVNTGQVIYQ